MPRASKVRRYAPATVIAAQRRVLNLLHGYVSKNLKPDTLYSDGIGLMTGAELVAHLDAARKVKVKRRPTVQEGK